MKPKSHAIEVVVEHGHLKPLRRLSLPEHQHLWITILSETPSTHALGTLASKSPSFQFLADPAEDRYSLDDGQPV